MGNSAATFFIQQSGSVKSDKLQGASSAGKPSKGFPLFQAMLSDTLASQTVNEKGFVSVKTVPKTLEDLQRQSHGKIQIAILPKGSVKFDENGNIQISQKVLEAIKNGKFDTTALQNNSESSSETDETPVITLDKSGDMNALMQTIQSFSGQPSPEPETGNVLFIFSQNQINDNAVSSGAENTSANLVSLTMNNTTPDLKPDTVPGKDEILKILQNIGDNDDGKVALKALQTIVKSTNSPDIDNALQEYKDMQEKDSSAVSLSISETDETVAQESQDAPISPVTGFETLSAPVINNSLMRPVLESSLGNKSGKRTESKKENTGSSQDKTQDERLANNLKNNGLPLQDLKEPKVVTQPAAAADSVPGSLEGLPPDIQAILQQAIQSYNKENPAAETNPDNSNETTNLDEISRVRNQDLSIQTKQNDGHRDDLISELSSSVSLKIESLNLDLSKSDINNLESLKSEPANPEPANPEPVKQEPVKQEPVKQEPVKQEPVKQEPVKQEIFTSELFQSGFRKIESVKPEISILDSSMTASSKPEIKNPEISGFIKTESLKPEISKLDLSAATSSKPEISKLDSSMTDSSKPEDKSPEISKFIKTESLKSEISILDLSVETSPKPELKKTEISGFIKSESLKPEITKRNLSMAASSKLEISKSETLNPGIKKPDILPAVIEKNIETKETKIHSVSSLQPLFTAVKKLQEQGKLDELTALTSAKPSAENTQKIVEILSQANENSLETQPANNESQTQEINSDKKIVSLPVIKPEASISPMNPSPVIGFVLVDSQETQETGNVEDMDLLQSQQKPDNDFPTFAAMNNSVPRMVKNQVAMEKVPVPEHTEEETQAQILEEFSKAVKSTKTANSTEPVIETTAKFARTVSDRINSAKERATESFRNLESHSRAESRKQTESAKDFVLQNNTQEKRVENIVSRNTQKLDAAERQVGVGKTVDDSKPLQPNSFIRMNREQNSEDKNAGDSTKTIKNFFDFNNTPGENTESAGTDNAKQPVSPATGSGKTGTNTGATTNIPRTNSIVKDPFKLFLEQDSVEATIAKELTGNQGSLPDAKTQLEKLDLESKRLAQPSLTIMPLGRGTVGQPDTVIPQTSTSKNEPVRSAERVILPKDKRYVLYKVDDEDLPRKMTDKNEKVVLVSELKELTQASRPFESMNQMQHARNFSEGLEVLTPHKKEEKNGVAENSAKTSTEKMAESKPVPKVAPIPEPPVNTVSFKNNQAQFKPADVNNSANPQVAEIPQPSAPQVANNPVSSEKTGTEYVQNQDTSATNSSNNTAEPPVANTEPQAAGSSALEYTEKIAKLQESVSRQVVQNVQGSVGSERSFIAIRLEPESLGTLAVHLKMESGKLTANFMAEKESTRALIEKSLGSLRQSFEESGLKVEKITISGESMEVKQPDNSKSDSQSSRFGRSKDEQPASQFSREFNQRKRQSSQWKEWKERLTAEDYYA